jgi:hypothetical protein
MFTTQCSTKKCPKPEVLSPCKCDSNDEEYFQINCITGETIDIKKILTKASQDPDVVNTIFDRLYISPANNTEFPEGTTGKLRFKEVRIEHILQRIHSKAFASSQDTMVDLTIYKANFTNGPAPYSLVDLINSFPNLKSLWLDSLIDTIQDGSLSVNLTNVS